MARKIDKQSKRQKVFAYLNGQMDRPRAEVVNNIMVQFGMGRSYAMTLYQNHRKDGIESGTLTEVVRVCDRKDGKSVSPFISIKYVADPKPNESRSKVVAVKRYETNLKAKIAEAKKL